MYPWDDIILRLCVALVLGGLIGFERQWHSRYVGLRTNTLLTLGATAMTYFGILLTKGDVGNMVHIISAIITGVGFLGAGVIIQEGVTVKGVSTAATLWCSVAVGLFVGDGYFVPAVILTAFVILVNLFLRPMVYCINAKTAEEEPALPHKHKKR
jgi:putative Mg2+ transporter-C (MgtC) family protein